MASASWSFHAPARASRRFFIRLLLGLASGNSSSLRTSELPRSMAAASSVFRVKEILFRLFFISAFLVMEPRGERVRPAVGPFGIQHGSLGLPGLTAVC